jgi:hypothetical protein
MVSRINALCLVSLLLTACGAGEADEAPAFEPSAAGSAGSAGDTSSAGSAGAAGTTQLAQAGTGGTGGSSPVSDECEFHGPYRLVAVLTAGGASCAAGSEIEAALQGRDEDACTGTLCSADGRFCVDTTCAGGNPVEDCSATVSNGNGCTYEWTMVRGG